MVDRCMAVWRSELLFPVFLAELLLRLLESTPFNGRDQLSPQSHWHGEGRRSCLEGLLNVYSQVFGKTRGAIASVFAREQISALQRH